MTRLTIGQVGCGNWGRNILRDLLALDCKVLVADIDPAARALASQRGAHVVCEDAASLPTCDAYVVAVPIPDLAPVCAGLLDRGRPIFSEKTLCPTLETAGPLERRGARELVFAMHKWRYHPAIEALRQTAESGRIGTATELFTYRLGWPEDFHGGDVLSLLAVHDLTIARHILGTIPEPVASAVLRCDHRGIPVALTASLGSGPVAHLQANARHVRKVSSVTIHGDRGMAMLGDACDPFITIRADGGEEKVAIDTTYPLYLELKIFVEYLKGGPPPPTGFRQVLEIAATLDNLRESARCL